MGVFLARPSSICSFCFHILFGHRTEVPPWPNFIKNPFCNFGSSTPPPLLQQNWQTNVSLGSHLWVMTLSRRSRAQSPVACLVSFAEKQNWSFLQNKNHYAVSTLKMLFIVKKKLNFFGIFLRNSLPSPPWKKMRLHPVMGVGATATSEL